MSEELQQPSEVVTETVEAPAAPVQLQLSDLLLAAQVVQLAATRGAIKAEEMTQVGGLYERLVTFLQSSGALQPAEADTTSTGEAPVDTPAAE